MFSFYLDFYFSDNSPSRSRSSSLKNAEVQTENSAVQTGSRTMPPDELYESGDEDVLRRLDSGKLKHRMLEDEFPSSRAVSIRRKFIGSQIGRSLAGLPNSNYDYSLVSFFIIVPKKKLSQILNKNIRFEVNISYINLSI